MGLRWYFRCGCPISKPRLVWGFSSKNQGSIFSKSESELVWPQMMFLAILAKNRWFSDNSDMLANSRLTSVELFVPGVKKIKKLFVHAAAVVVSLALFPCSLT